MFLTRLPLSIANNGNKHYHWQITLLSLFVLTPNLNNTISFLISPNTQTPDQPPQRSRANATLLMLASNSDIDDAVQAIHELENRFNDKYRYPWVFLNEQPFSDDFKRYVRLTPILNLCILCS